MEQLAAYDRYPWEYNTFILGGDVILIENDLLADALNALPQENRDILLMYWFPWSWVPSSPSSAARWPIS